MRPSTITRLLTAFALVSLAVMMALLPVLAQVRTKTVGRITMTRRSDGLLVMISTGHPARPVTMATLKAAAESWGQGFILVSPASFNDFSGGLDIIARGAKPGWRGSLGSSTDEKMGLSYYTLPNDAAQVVLFDRRQSQQKINAHEYVIDPGRTPALAAVALTRPQAEALLKAFRELR